MAQTDLENGFFDQLIRKLKTLKEISEQYNELNRATDILLERVEKDDALKKNLEKRLRKLQSVQVDVGALQNGVTESLIENISKIMRETGMYAHLNTNSKNWEFYIKPVEVNGVIRDKIDMIGEGMKTTRKELVQKMNNLNLDAANVQEDDATTISVVDKKTIGEGNKTFLKSLREQLVPSPGQSSNSSNTGDEDDEGIEPTGKTYREVLEMYINDSIKGDFYKSDIRELLKSIKDDVDLSTLHFSGISTRSQDPNLNIRNFLIETVDANAQGSDSNTFNSNTFTTIFEGVQLNNKVVFANECFNIQTDNRRLVPLVDALGKLLKNMPTNS